MPSLYGLKIGDRVRDWGRGARSKSDVHFARDGGEQDGRGRPSISGGTAPSFEIPPMHRQSLHSLLFVPLARLTIIPLRTAESRIDGASFCSVLGHSSHWKHHLVSSKKLSFSCLINRPCNWQSLVYNWLDLEAPALFSKTFPRNFFPSTTTSVPPSPTSYVPWVVRHR
jgi:hypothetical protein